MISDKILYDLEEKFGKWWENSFETPTMTNKLYPYTNMFSPIKINKLTIKNRLVMGPMGNISMAEETGRPNQKMINYFEERAKGGVGLITTGLIPVSYGIDPTVKELGDLSYFPRIDRSRTVQAGWRDLSSAVHAYNSHIFVQLTAGLGRVGNPQCLLTQLKLPVSASWNPNFYMSQIPCKRLSDGKIKKLIKNFGQASADAKALNIDGVYLHGHEGYLMEQLTNTAFNRRSLGKYSDWQRFGIDVVTEIRKRVGPDYPIMYRIDLSLALKSTYQDKLKDIKSIKKYKNERTIQQTFDYMTNLVKAGVDMFDVDLGCYDNWWLPHPPASMPSGCYLDVAKLAKDYFKANNIKSNAGLPVPIVAVGKLGYPDFAEKALREEKCDMIMLARPLLADPQWPNKAYRGECNTILPCIGCHEACIKEFVDGGHPQCAVNPRTAFEDVFAKQLPKAEKIKNVAVIGAGPAGIVATKTLLERGHAVHLYEANKVIGGNLNPASVPKIKYEVKNYLNYLNEQIKFFETNNNFKLHLGKKVEAKDLKNKYDAIVLATGSAISIPNIKGSESKNVISVVDGLMNPELIKNANNVVIIGGGDSGCEAGYWSGVELGKNTTIVEMREALMMESCTANRGHILHYLEKNKVKAYNCTSLVEIKEHSVILKQNTHSSVPNPYNTWQPLLPENVVNPLAPKIKEKFTEIEVPADIVLMAIGTKPQNKLYYELVQEQACPEIYQIGDAIKPGKIFATVKSAYRTCKDI